MIITYGSDPPLSALKVNEWFPQIFFRFRNWTIRVGHQTLTEHALDVLRHIPEHERVRLTWLAQHLELTKGAVSLMVKKLVRAGLVERKRNPANEREVLIRLKPRGAELLRKNPILDLRALERHLAALSREERERILEGLDLLLRRRE